MKRTGGKTAERCGQLEYSLLLVYLFWRSVAASCHSGTRYLAFNSGCCDFSTLGKVFNSAWYVRDVLNLISSGLSSSALTRSLYKKAKQTREATSRVLWDWCYNSSLEACDLKLGCILYFQTISLGGIVCFNKYILLPLTIEIIFLVRVDKTPTTPLSLTKRHSMTTKRLHVESNFPFYLSGGEIQMMGLISSNIEHGKAWL
jgi:hypothetical protein